MTQSSKPDYKPGDYLSVMQVCHIFCERLGIGQTTFFAHYRRKIKFRIYGSTPGSVKKIKYKEVLEYLDRLDKNAIPEGSGNG